MNIGYSCLVTVLVGVCTFIKYGTSCDMQCDSGYRCVMRRSTCDYPPCPYFPTCVQQHNAHHNTHQNRYRHRQSHTVNSLQRHESHHRNDRHSSTIIHLISSDSTSESQPTEPIPSHPGRCPAPSGYGPCITTCRNDGDCQASEKCCGNGCGQICTTVNNVLEVKPGTCPRRVRFLFRACSTECNNDNECPGIQKCCNTACGSVCSDPCFHWLTRGQRSSGSAIMWKLPLLCRS